MQKPTSAPTADSHTAAKKCLDLKQYKEAEQHIHAILRKNINDGAGLALLADLNVAQNKIEKAMAFYIAAICADSAVLAHKEKFIEYCGYLSIDKYEEINGRAILECLKSGDALDCSELRVVWLQHLLLEPAFQAAFGLTQWKNFDTENNGRIFGGIANFKPLLTPYFLLGLKNLVIHNPVFEEFITRLRLALLADFGTYKKFTAEEMTALAAAVAHYGSATDYILDVADEEQKAVDMLRAALEGLDSSHLASAAAAVALIAAYVPLHQLANAADVAGAFAAHPDLGSVVRAQITDYARLIETAAQVQSATAITNAVSAKVQEQYEEFPYPRWKAASVHRIRAQWDGNPKNAAVTNRLSGTAAKILIAGCGTGQQALMYAAVFPDAEILAVDLSRSSLAYAIEQARVYQVNNVTFRQADILHLDSLGQSFDLVVCVGVLHHMQDPAAGWQVLSRCVKPDGLMRIGLYSKIARAAVMRTAALAKREGYGDDVRGMKSFRRNSPAVLDRSTLDDLAGFADYYTLNEYRDLLFHAQEHNYTLLEIDELLEKTGLSFIDFTVPMAAPPDQQPGESTLAAWHRFEQQNPRTFRGMYIFWCRKKDAA